MRISNIFVKPSKLVVCTCLIILFISPTYISAVSKDGVVDISVAQFVAAEYLPKLYRGEWISFSLYTYYDIDGKPAAYAFVFRKPDSQITSVEELEVVMADAHEKRKKVRHQLYEIEQSKNLSEDYRIETRSYLKQEMRKENKGLYQFDDFATVVTGATETSSLIIRCYHGFPPIVVERLDLQQELDTNYANEHFALGRILFYGTVDIRYEVVSASDNRPITPESIQNGLNPVSDKAYAITWKEKSLTRISTRRQQIEDAIANREKEMAKMEDAARKQYEEGIENRKKRNISKWLKYRAKASTAKIN